MKNIFFLWSKVQCNDIIIFRGGGGGGGASQEDILGLAISLIFDQFSILSSQLENVTTTWFKKLSLY